MLIFITAYFNVWHKRTRTLGRAGVAKVPGAPNTGSGPGFDFAPVPTIFHVIQQNLYF